MRKNGLLVGALALGSLLPLSSCIDTYAITEVRTFEEAYDLFEKFFSKTFENTHMEVEIAKSWDPGQKWELTSRETIQGTSSYCTGMTSKDHFYNSWAYILGDGMKVSATEKNEHDPEDNTVTTVEKTYSIGDLSYSNTYKSYIKGLNYIEYLARESALTGKTPEELAGSNEVYCGINGLGPIGTSQLMLHLQYVDVKKEIFDSKYFLWANRDNETGLITSASVSYYDDFGYQPSLSSVTKRDTIIKFTMNYDDVRDISLPDLKDYEYKDK